MIRNQEARVRPGDRGALNPGYQARAEWRSFNSVLEKGSSPVQRSKSEVDLTPE
jgi:hypothetical protein